MNILFHCEASPRIGTGHVFRCLTLAHYMSMRGWACAFYCKEETLSIVKALQHSGFEVLHSFTGLQASYEVCVIDHYELDAATESDFRKLCERVVVIDDLANRPHDCDVLIDQTLGRQEEDYKPFTPENCQILAGPQYALLRQEFAALRTDALSRRKDMAGKVGAILISLGGTDPDNTTSLFLEAIEALESSLDIHVVLSSAATHKSAIAERCSEVGAHFYTDVGNMADIMLKADLAVGAGGTTSWERCCLGLPTLMIEIADNQKFVAKALHEAGAVYNLGVVSQVSKQDVVHALNKLIDAPDMLLEMSNKAGDVCDGWGAARTAPYLLSPVKDTWLRRVEMDDMKLLFEWQQYEETRRYARNPEIPSWDEHKAWFQSKIYAQDTDLYIIMREDTNAGMLRLDRREEKTKSFEVSILTNPLFYRKQIASSALQLARQLEPKAELWAEILAENKASRKLFESLDYKPVNDTWFVNTPHEHV